MILSEDMAMQVAVMLQGIKSALPPGYTITLIARKPDGDVEKKLANICFTEDNYIEAIAVLASIALNSDRGRGVRSSICVQTNPDGAAKVVQGH